MKPKKNKNYLKNSVREVANVESSYNQFAAVIDAVLIILNHTDSDSGIDMDCRE